jgi:hypothetical protein
MREKATKRATSRRQLLSAVGAGALAAIAGCQADSEGDETPTGTSDRTATETATTTSEEPAFDPVTVDVSPTATYLLTSNDAADDTTPIALGDQPFGPGDRITLERLGEFDNGAPGGSAGLGMHAVFSESADLLGQSERNRVADAINVGPDHVTSRTYYGSNETDIPEDFLVSNNDGSQTSVTVDIPESATHLFVAARDNLYEDNSVSGDQFAVQISDGLGATPATTEETTETGTEGGTETGDAVTDPDTTVDLDPSTTYLRMNGDGGGDADPISLGEYDIAPGDTVTLSVLGTYDNGSGDRRGTAAVFSGSSELADDGQNRVVDAIDAGTDVETSATFFGGNETDIPEDFAVADEETFASVTLTVPESATHLFVTPRDNLFGDNTSNDYRLGLTVQ